jgi:hypothetical protein
MSSSYGFKIEVEGNAIKSIHGIEGELGHLEHKSKETQSKINEHFGKLGESVKGFGMSMKSLAVGGLGIGALFGGAELAKASLEAFDKYEEGVAKLEAVIKSTGGAAGRSIEELKDGAKELSGQTLFDKAAIMDAQSMLLTFTSIRGEIFDKTMPAVANFATRFKMEMPEAANTLGKALNDPLKGMTRLQRQGVVFSDQQKETIKNFMATGQIAKAQGVILKELDTEFGGLATAMSKTDAGKIKMAEKALSEMKLTIGELINKGLVKLTPLIEGIGDIFHKTFGKDVVKDLEESKGKMNDLFETLKTGNLSLDERKSIISELNTEYGPYLKSLITENMTTEDLASAQSYSNAQMIKKIEIEVNEEAIKKIMAEYSKLEIKHLERIIEFNKAKREAEESAKRNKDILKRQGGDKVQEAYDIKATASLQQFYVNNAARRLANSESDLKVGKDKMDKWLMDMLGITAPDFKKRTLAEINADIAKNLHPDKGGKITPGGGLGEGAINTSLLSGASGGLGEAKIIHIDFHAPLMKIDIPGGNGKDVVDKAPLAMEQLIRITNNLSQSQGSTF